MPDRTSTTHGTREESPAERRERQAARVAEWEAAFRSAQADARRARDGITRNHND